MRLLVTGSRDWWPPSTVYQWLNYYATRTDVGEPFVVVHGACWRGADKMASDWVALHRGTGIPVAVEAHPADWRPHGIYNPQAGLIRNRKMVELGADLCLAFIRNGSRGAMHCAGLAEEAGIPTRRFTA